MQILVNNDVSIDLVGKKKIDTNLLLKMDDETKNLEKKEKQNKNNVNHLFACLAPPIYTPRNLLINLYEKI